MTAVHVPASTTGDSRPIVFDSGDTTATASLAVLLQASVDQGARHLVVDLGDAEMVNSATLTTLKRVGGRLRMTGGQLSVVCSNARLASLLDLTLLSRSFALFRTLDAALAGAPVSASPVTAGPVAASTVPSRRTG